MLTPLDCWALGHWLGLSPAEVRERGITHAGAGHMLALMT